MKTQIDASKYTAHQHPGKFEGETPETEYFYEQMMQGDGDDIYSNFSIDPSFEPEEDEQFGYSATIFTVQTDESEAFGLNHGDIFMIYEDSQGFVYGSVHASHKEAEAEFRAWIG